MNILIVHNRYLQAGGEDTVAAAERALLEADGHAVTCFDSQNEDLTRARPIAQARAAIRTVYSWPARRDLIALIRGLRPDVVHVHNSFHHLSPSVFDACREGGVPVVNTLHNYRLLCVNALLYRDGHICEKCVGRAAPWGGIRHACYRDSRAASATVAAMVGFHRLRGTWSDRVTLFIALTEFARQKFIAGGLPADRIVVKPNLVYPTPTAGAGGGGFALFVGRLSVEKGVTVLLDAWKQIGTRLPLVVLGDGPLAPIVRAAAASTPGIEWRGRLPRDQVLDLMKQAELLVFPSVWYEMFSMTALEAMSVGLPVIASNLGSIGSIVGHERTGLLFAPGHADDLARQVQRTLAQPAELARMRLAARAEFEAHYTAERNRELLLSIYRQAIAANLAAPGRRPAS